MPAPLIWALGALGGAAALRPLFNDDAPQAALPQLPQDTYDRLPDSAKLILGPNQPAPAPSGPGVLGRLGDLATYGTAGALSLAADVPGLLQIKPLESALDRAAAYVRSGATPESRLELQQQQEALSDAFSGDKTLPARMLQAGNALLSPATLNLAAESLPGMIAGGGAGAALRATRIGGGLSALGGAAIGEGLVSGVSQAGQIRDEGGSVAQQLAGLGTGAVTGGITYGAGRGFQGLARANNRTARAVGQFFENADPETLIASRFGKEAAQAAYQGRPAALLAGIIREGLFEELWQSVAEQVQQNAILGKPLDEGVAVNAVLGTALGALMGGTAGFISADNLQQPKTPLLDNYRDLVFDSSRRGPPSARLRPAFDAEGNPIEGSPLIPGSPGYIAPEDLVNLDPSVAYLTQDEKLAAIRGALGARKRYDNRLKNVKAEPGSKTAEFEAGNRLGTFRVLDADGKEVALPTKPNTVPQNVWNAVLDEIAALENPTPEVVDAMLKQLALSEKAAAAKVRQENPERTGTVPFQGLPGFGKKAADTIRKSPWLANVLAGRKEEVVQQPKAPEAEGTAAPKTPPAPHSDEVQKPVDEHAAANNLSPEDKAELGQSVAVDNIPDDDSVDAEFDRLANEYEEKLGPESPGTVRGRKPGTADGVETRAKGQGKPAAASKQATAAPSKPFSPNPLHGLYNALSGYFSGSLSGERELPPAYEDATPKKRNQIATWLRRAARSDKTVGQLDVSQYMKPIPTVDAQGAPGPNRPATFTDLMNGIHRETLQLERAKDRLSSRSRTSSGVNRYDIPLEANYDDALAKAKEANPTATEEQLQAIADETFAAEYGKNILLYAKSAKALAGHLQVLEKLVGSAAILRAMSIGKQVQFNKAREAAPGSRLTAETPEAVRFSQYYGLYRLGQLGDHTVPTRDVRLEYELDRRMNSKAPYLTRQLEKIARGETRTPGSKVQSRPANMLLHIRRISHSAMSGQIASSLYRVMQEHGLDVAGDTRLQLVVKDTESDPNSPKAGAIFRPGPPGTVGEITIYKGGNNEEAILHEFLHALTFALLPTQQDINAWTKNPNVKKAGTNDPLITPGQQNLIRIAQSFGKLDNAARARAITGYGEDTATAIEAIYEYVAKGELALAITELMSYGLTNASFQRWMAATKYQGEQLNKLSLGSMWNAFRVAIRSLLGMSKAVPNNIFDRFLEASSTVLKQTEGGDATAKTGPSIAKNPFSAYRKASGPIDGVASNISRPQPYSAEQAMLDANVAATTRAREEMAQSREGVGLKAQADLRKTAGRNQQRTQQDEAAGQRFSTAKSGSAVSNPKFSRKTPKRDVLFSDAFLRGVMNAVAGLIPGNSKADWEFAMEGLLQRGGNWLVEWASRESNFFQRALSMILKGTVDQYGVELKAPGVSDKIQQAFAAIHGSNWVANQAVTELNNLSPQTAQAVLEYLEHRDVNTLRNNITDDKDSVVRHVTKLVDALDGAVRDMVQLGIAPEGAIEAREMPDGSTKEIIHLENLISITPDPGSIASKAQVGGMLGTSREMLAMNHIEDKVHDTLVLNAAGRTPEQFHPGREYKMWRDADLQVVYVDVAAPESVYQRYGLTPVLKDQRPYRVTKYSRTNAEVTMRRPKTVDERSRNGRTAKVIPSLAATLNKWQRLVSFNALFDQALLDNEQLPPEAKYIFDLGPAVAGEDTVDPSLTRAEGYAPQKLYSIARQKGESVDEYGNPRAGAAMRERDLVAAARTPGTLIELPNDPKKWGALAGKWIAGPVYAALYDQSTTDRVIGHRSIQALNHAWKKNKTAWSLGTHIQNIMGNFILMYKHDIPADNVHLAGRLIWSEMMASAGKKGKFGGQKLSEADLALLEEFHKSGATLGQFSTAELSPDAASLLNDFIRRRPTGDKGSPKSILGILTGMETLIAGISKTDDALTAAYSNQDNVFRLAAYMTYIQRWIGDNGKNVEVPVEVKQAAAQYAKKAFVDYNITAPWVNFARQTYAPFISFPYRMAPMMAKLALTKPWKTATVLGTIYAVNALSYATLDADEDKERNAMPEYLNREMFGISGLPHVYVRLPFGDENHPTFYPLGNFVPVANAFEIDPAGIPSMLAWGGPLPTIVNAVNGWDPFFQRPLRQEANTTGQNIAGTADYLYRAMAPQLLVETTKALDKAAIGGGKLGPLGEESNAWLAFSRIAGLRAVQTNLNEQQYMRSAEIQRIMREYGTARNKYIRDHLRRGNPDPQDIQEYILENRQNLIEAVQKAQRGHRSG